jgi:hypothetical protein
MGQLAGHPAGRPEQNHRNCGLWSFGAFGAAVSHLSYMVSHLSYIRTMRDTRRERYT